MTTHSRAELVALFGEPAIEGNLDPGPPLERGETMRTIVTTPIDFANLPPSPASIPGIGRWMMWKPRNHEPAKVAFSADSAGEDSWHLMEVD